MKKITCEVCQSTDFLKADGVFTCQSCGTKYSVGEVSKMVKDVTDPNFISKLELADKQAEKYFFEGADSVIYGNISGYDAVINYYEDAKSVSAREPELLLHFIEFYIRANIDGFKTGYRTLINAQEFRDFCVVIFDNAKKYAEEKQIDEECISEIDKKISELMKFLDEELPKAEERKKNSRKKSKRVMAIFGIITGAVVILFIAALIYFRGSLNNASNIDMKTVKEKLVNYTEYVRQNIVGTWSTSDGIILEFYSNGMIVEYKPVSNDADPESAIKNELYSIHYSRYEIITPESYTDDNLQSFAEYSQQSDRIAIPIKAGIDSAIPDSFVWQEFVDDDTMIMGGLTLDKINGGDPTITDRTSGIYVNENEKDKSACLNVIQINGTQTGYVLLSGRSLDEIEGICDISEKTICAKFPGSADFIFERLGNDVIEISSDKISGSKLTYTKISDLSCISHDSVIVAEEDSNREFLPQEEIQSKNTSVDFSAFNGSFKGGGVLYDGHYIGQWGSTISNATSDSILFSFGQSESDYYVENVMLYKQNDGSYQGSGLSTWGLSYFTVWLETPDCISVTVEGSADSTGTEKLYRSEF